MFHAKETGISSGHLGLWLVYAFTFLPLYHEKVINLEEMHPGSLYLKNVIVNEYRSINFIRTCDIEKL